MSELLRAMGIENPEGETERVSKILEDIKKALNNQNYDKAIRLAENAQQLFPDNSELLDISVEAYYRKGVLLYRNRYFFDAINLFNDLLRLKPGHKNALKFRLIAQLQLLVIYLKNKLLVVPHSRVAQMVIAGFLILMLLGLSIYALSIDRGDSNQVTPTPTVTNSVIASVVASNRVTSTLTQILTNTLLPPTATPSPTSLPTDTPTGIFTFAPSPTSTVTLTNTSTPTATLIATPIITPSPASTVTPTNTSTPTATLPATPIITPSPTAIPLPPVTDTPIVPTGQFILLKPTSPDEPTRGFTDFEWQWGGQIDPTTHGFEVRIWREGGVPQGIHNSAEGISNSTEDYRKGKVVALGNGKYGLFVDISQAPGVLGQSGEYLWTVVLVQISPEYKDLGIQATPRHLRFAAGGRGGGGNVPNPSPPGHDTSSQ
ncbi:MAG: hypothetical protein HYR94_22010 [Chloroflexi bacterium]|nr:hypothetical protein [Chloroflexota bacterium]